MKEVDDIVRPLVTELDEAQRDDMRHLLSTWSSLLLSLALRAPERDVEAVRSSLLRLL